MPDTNTLGQLFDKQLVTIIEEAQAQECVERVLRANIQLDRYGLVVPSAKLQDIYPLIVENLIEARHRIQHVMLEGKTVVYFPGAFDLVHVGHATFFQQGIDLFLKTHGRLKREDLFVVVLADSDDLIEAAKPAHLYAGKGEHPRPIQSGKVFNHLLRKHTNVNPRLLDLAACGIDMVGLLPSPAEVHSLLDNWFFQEWLKKNSEFEGDAIEVVAGGVDELATELRNALNDYLKIVKAIKEGHFERVQTSFEQVKFNLPSSTGETFWTLPAWQLLLNRFLGFVHQFPNAGCYRVISIRDGYGGFVKRLMELSRVRHAAIDDIPVVSTTTLLKTYGWEVLYQAKVQSFTALCAR